MLGVGALGAPRPRDQLPQGDVRRLAGQNSGWVRGDRRWTDYERVLGQMTARALSDKPVANADCNPGLMTRDCKSSESLLVVCFVFKNCVDVIVASHG